MNNKFDHPLEELGSDSMAQPRVLLFPFPASGHTQPFLHLATLLAGAGLDVVFLSTEHDHCRIVNLDALTTRFPKLHFETISDGLPPDRPRDILDAEFYWSMRNGTKPRFRQLLQSFNDDSRRPITCIVADVVISAPTEVAEELGIPVISFCPCSARYLSIHFWIPKLVEERQIPYADDNSEGAIYGLPSFEDGLLRRKDLPGFWHTKFISEQNSPIAFVNQTVAARRTSGLILNTFDELEAPFLTHLSSICKKIYPIGPLHLLSKSKFSDSSSSSFLGGFYKADESCLSWLDSQPSRSVIFVCFGSTGRMKADELVELWHGLVNSGQPFLCVLRSDALHTGERGKSVKELMEEGGKEVNGIVVEWAPQQKVLNHPAIGAFLTHCGWNSAIESIAAGVPMMCWPVLGDQLNNATWIAKIWKTGLEIKDKWDRSTVEKMVRALVEDPNGEIRRSIEKLSKLANETVGEGGLSAHNLEILIEDIKKVATK